MTDFKSGKESMTFLPSFAYFPNLCPNPYFGWPHSCLGILIHDMTTVEGFSIPSEAMNHPINVISWILCPGIPDEYHLSFCKLAIMPFQRILLLC